LLFYASWLRISLRDADGVVYSVEVQAETLFEAAAAAWRCSGSRVGQGRH
jgi:hypothetical protein